MPEVYTRKKHMRHSSAKRLPRHKNPRYRSRSVLCHYGTLQTTLTCYLRQFDNQLNLAIGDTSRFVIALGVIQMREVLFKDIVPPDAVQREIERYEAWFATLGDEREEYLAQQYEAKQDAKSERAAS